ncbi:hypothetical protein G7Y89_g4742 [Cudoniella acicularis]|uniref:Uncharacterized protein n=1 Tax=Cudoniella acicularis TaxID=354080 RepID=A0A8H4W4N3_9HELO|nr:hypothetical protein G7Y89_g4742 [Cudoniella acicularis]
MCIFDHAFHQLLTQSSLATPLHYPSLNGGLIGSQAFVSGLSCGLERIFTETLVEVGHPRLTGVNLPPTNPARRKDIENKSPDFEKISLLRDKILPTLKTKSFLYLKFIALILNFTYFEMAAITTELPSTPSYLQEQPHNVSTTINYHIDTDDGSKPLPYIVGQPQTYYRPSKPLSVTVHDIRGNEEKYTLDTNGFEIFRHESKEREFSDWETIKREYFPETEQLLKDATGATRVFIFGHQLRRKPQATDNPENLAREPVRRAHIDQTYSAARARVVRHLGEEAETLLKGRFQIINVWRPIKTIYKDPLAVADANSVPDTDLIPVQIKRPDYIAEAYTVRPNEQHQWYYCSRQTPQEVMFIKCFDSKTDGRARRVVHSSFIDPETAGEQTRESIEVRALLSDSLGEDGQGFVVCDKRRVLGQRSFFFLSQINVYLNSLPFGLYLSFYTKLRREEGEVALKGPYIQEVSTGKRGHVIRGQGDVSQPPVAYSAILSKSP